MSYLAAINFILDAGRIESGIMRGVQVTHVRLLDPRACKGCAVSYHSFDFGVCSQAGYRDAGEYWTCEECGRVVDERELAEAPPAGWLCNALPEEKTELATEETTDGIATIEDCPF